MKTVVSNSQHNQLDMTELAPPARALSTQREPGQVVKFIAHQGAQGIYPPNSLAALEQAFGVADCVEFDVYAANRADNTPEVVVIHPEGYFLYVNHAGMQNEKPLPMTFEETRKHTVAGKPQIPTVDEVLDTYLRRCNETGKRSELHIELKGPGTAEVVLPILQKRIAEGQLSYSDFALTGLSYPGDRGRLVAARELDKDVRLVFVARGGDYSQDGFNGLEDALAFATSINADTFTVARRGLPLQDIQKIRDAGFMVGTFHCRTSDEAEAASALGAEYVAADDFRGASILSYTNARIQGSPLYHQMDALGFFHTRDWIWEIGWESEKSREKAVDVQRAATSASEAVAHTGGLSLQPDGSSTLFVCTKGTPTGVALDFSAVTVSSKFLVPVVGKEDPLHTPWKEVLSDETLVGGTRQLLDALTPQSAREDLMCRMKVSTFDREVIMSLAELAPELCSDEERGVVEVCRQALTRYGRLVGTLAFSALTPRHGDESAYTVSIQAPHLERSPWVRLAVEEQVAAQGLRSGKTCRAAFV